jgi:hypothetical protein
LHLTAKSLSLSQLNSSIKEKIGQTRELKRSQLESANRSLGGLGMNRLKGATGSMQQTRFADDGDASKPSAVSFPTFSTNLDLL